MRYLTLSANYIEPHLRDEATGDSDIAFSSLSEALVQQILQWNRDYQPVVSLASGERQARSNEIDRLDEVGRVLARRVAEELAPAKVGYYSEGWLRYLT